MWRHKLTIWETVQCYRKRKKSRRALWRGLSCLAAGNRLEWHRPAGSVAAALPRMGGGRERATTGLGPPQYHHLSLPRNNITELVHTYRVLWGRSEVRFFEARGGMRCIGRGWRVSWWGVRWWFWLVLGRQLGRRWWRWSCWQATEADGGADRANQVTALLILRWWHCLVMISMTRLFGK